MVKLNDETWYFVNLPETDYAAALQLQHRLVAARADNRLGSDVLLLLEHPAVFTLGRSGGRKSLKVDEAFLNRRGIPLVRAERGGDITYHGPGQLVAYLIVDFKQKKKDVQVFVHRLEEVMLRTVSDFGIEGVRSPLNRGVWCGMEKLGSVGLAVSRGIGFHGFSLNVHPDLEPFEWIHPCGLDGIRATSMESILGRPVSIERVRQSLAAHFQSVFDARLDTRSLKSLRSSIE